jgi:GT2 family glycosyltransferase
MTIQTSVIIVTYNNFDTTTGPCLKSLLKHDKKRDFEIVLIDNASQDDTPEKVRALAEKEEDVRLLVNNVNRGFAGGNNDGAKIARGKILILLNSDTIVSPGAIEKLTQPLDDHPDWGMLGPVTNEAGNEQKIFTTSGDQDEIIRQGEEWCEYSKGDYFLSERLDFFCVAVRKSIYEQLGGLDEQFGVGYYEDVDFSIRASLEDIKMMVAEDCFVYHRSGETFSKIGRERIKSLMRENKRILKKKYPGTVKLFHMRDMNLNIMRQYLLLRKERPINRDRLNYKFNNRLLLANTMYPRNPFKKLLYYFKLKRIYSDFYQERD